MTIKYIATETYDQLFCFDLDWKRIKFTNNSWKKCYYWIYKSNRIRLEWNRLEREYNEWHWFYMNIENILIKNSNVENVSEEEFTNAIKSVLDYLQS